MGGRKSSASDHQYKQDRATKKVADQEAVLRLMNGSADDHPEEQQLLNETRHNKAAIDLNRAMFDYDEEHRNDKPSPDKP